MLKTDARVISQKLLLEQKKNDIQSKLLLGVQDNFVKKKQEEILKKQKSNLSMDQSTLDKSSFSD